MTSPRRKRGPDSVDDRIRHCTLAQLAMAEQMHSEAQFTLDGIPLGSVLVVANLLDTTSSGEHIQYHWLSDGTYGPGMRAQQWRTPGTADTVFDRDLCYVRVVGYLEKYLGRTYIRVKQLQRVEDFHEPIHHFFKCMAEMLIIERGAQPRPALSFDVASGSLPAEDRSVFLPPPSPAESAARSPSEKEITTHDKQCEADTSNLQTLNGSLFMPTVQGSEITDEFASDDQVIDLCADDSSSDESPSFPHIHNKGKMKAVSIPTPPHGSSRDGSHCNSRPSHIPVSRGGTSSPGFLTPPVSSPIEVTRQDTLSPKISEHWAPSTRKKDPYSALQPLHRDIILLMLSLTKEDPASLYPNLKCPDERNYTGVHIDTVVEKILAKHNNLDRDEFVEAFVSLKDDSYIYETIDELHFNVTPRT